MPPTLPQNTDTRPLLDIELLNTFLAVVKHGGLKPAATEVYRSQAAVSMQLKKLEAQLGTSLMSRSNRGIQLTQAGQTLKQYAERLVALNAATVSAVSQPLITGQLRIGVPSEYLPALLQKMMPALSMEFPGLDARIVCQRSRELQRLMALGALDMAIVATDNADERATVLWQETWVWHGAPRLLMTPEQPLAVALFSEDCLVRDWALADLKSGGAGHKVVLSTAVMDNVLAAVNADVALALVPESVLAAESRPALPDYLSRKRRLTISLLHQPELERQRVSRIQACILRASRAIRAEDE
ncbi:LysR family transcriptional regulator [Ferrimonas sp. SCSIO 43195]|uniref:LysR family transcriptional regulator n=1 Tax=Ferrimonas sp. SCSIO 43195 TaxID=2822844 RepID=UPI00207559BA|nr:LysR family transcriptional regulator [Ferrimonas sp. SCSIO 43195]USD36821.1 LysR family transcriptional regulator [Ferrimonas sp. SCSIO 43195]